MGDPWLSDQDIKVDIQQLQDFAKHIQEELEQNFKPSFENGVKPMLMVQSPFGAGGLEEARFFRARHDESRAAIAAMLGDAMKGLVSLHMAASSIAAEYLNGDAMASATIDDVYKAFNGSEGQKTLEDYWSDTPGEQQADGAIPEEAKDPGKYFRDGDNDGRADTDTDTGGMYDQTTIADGTSGEYTIQGDAEDLNRPELDVETPEH